MFDANQKQGLLFVFIERPVVCHSSINSMASTFQATRSLSDSANIALTVPAISCEKIYRQVSVDSLQNIRRRVKDTKSLSSVKIHRNSQSASQENAEKTGEAVAVEEPTMGQDHFVSTSYSESLDQIFQESASVHQGLIACSHFDNSNEDMNRRRMSMLSEEKSPQAIKSQLPTISASKGEIQTETVVPSLTSPPFKATLDTAHNLLASRFSFYISILSNLKKLSRKKSKSSGNMRLVKCWAKVAEFRVFIEIKGPMEE